MNIFALDECPRQSAIYHNDKHVVKMQLESVQMMCTVLSEHGIPVPYKAGWKNHPCTKWVRESLDNFMWLYDLTLYLNEEWKYRYNRVVDHKSVVLIKDCISKNGIPKSFLSVGRTKFATAMPEDCKAFSQNSIECYKYYYVNYKNHLSKWTKRSVPEWYTDEKYKKENNAYISV